MTKTLAKILAFAIRYALGLYVLWLVLKPCIEWYHKYGWIAIPGWIFGISLICAGVIAIIKLLDYLDHKSE